MPDNTERPNPFAIDINSDRIALVDLDGTVADYDGEMDAEMKLIKAPDEPDFEGWDNVPPHIKARRDLIKKRPGFWRNLPRLELGFQVVALLRSIGFELHVLTKGPVKTTPAWTEKVEWCQVNIPDAAITITHDKSLVYGRVLVDDFPPYFEAWLKVRPRGLVVCVAHPWNEQYADGKHPNVFRYDGNNRNELTEKLEEAWKRPSGKAR